MVDRGLVQGLGFRVSASGFRVCLKAHGLGSALLGSALLMTLILFSNSSDPFSWIVAILGFWEVLWLREFRRFIDVFLVVGVAGRFDGWSVWFRGFATLGVDAVAVRVSGFAGLGWMIHYVGAGLQEILGLLG